MLEDYREYMLRCARCSNCKFVPHAVLKGQRYSSICPSIDRYNFHAFSGGGRLVTALSVLDGRLEIDDDLVDIIYQCQTCGACDTSCKYGLDLELTEPIYGLRALCVEKGLIPEVHRTVMAGLKKEGNMMRMTRAGRGKWAAGLDIKDIKEGKSETYYHAGCRYAYDKGLWGSARGAVTVLKNAGIDVAIAGEDEACCGGRAYELGYVDDFRKFAPSLMERLKKAGVKTIVTSCSDCYHAFKVLHKKIGIDSGIKVFHITEYLNHLIGEGRIRAQKKVDKTVTYHDPCHLGRMGEPWRPWNGRIVTDPGSRIMHEPKKDWRKGTDGVYEAPRNVLKSIPGLRLLEMDRTKEYSYCCGAGGGVIDAYPDFNMATAKERITEARDTGAEAIVTSCPWCMGNFRDAIKEGGVKMELFDVVDLFMRSV